MRSKSSLFRFAAALAVTGALGVVAAPRAIAADRVVLFEHVTATWCGPCKHAGRGLTMMLDEYPDTVIAIQEHVSDAYANSWTNLRANKYNVSGIPHVVCDGIRNRIGASSAQGAYNIYNFDYQWRMDNYSPAPLGIVMTVTEQSAGVYEVMVDFTNESGTSMILDLQIVETLFDWPANGIDGEYNYCAMSGHYQSQVTIAAGATEIFTRVITLHPSSLANIDNLRFVAFGQVSGGGNQEVHNAGFADYPFGPDCPADLNGDGYIGQADLGLLLAAYGVSDGGDIDGDGDTDQADLGALLSVYETDC